jgi:16S rRNA (uracil1498-N3)-methyltransferase
VPAITVAFSLAKGDRTDWAAAKLAELGIDRIVPLVAGRTVVRPDEEGGARHRRERLQRIVREAAMQARLVHLPQLGEMCGFREAVGGALGPAGKVCAAEPGGAPPTLAAPVLLVGPEGGWTDEEVSILAGQSIRMVGLSAGVLRVETAAIVGGTLLTALRCGLAATP